MLLNCFLSGKKKFYIRTRIRVSQMAKIEFRKGVNICIEREGNLKDTQRNTQNAALNVDQS